MNYIVFDIETYSPGELERIDTNEFRVSVIGAYISWVDEYIAFIEGQEKDFLDLLKQAELVIGYNHIWFDLPVLKKYADWDIMKVPNYDIMLEIEKKIGFKPKLDDICKANLGSKKTDSYEVYKNYYKEKKWEELIDYCMNDVKLTHEIFLKIVNQGKLVYNDLLDTKEFELDKPKPGATTVVDDSTQSIF